MVGIDKGILQADNVEVSVSNTNSYTQIFHYNLQANSLSSNGLLRIAIRGLSLNGTGSSKELNVKMELFDGIVTSYVEVTGFSLFNGTREIAIDTEFVAVSTALQKAAIFLQQASYDAGSADENSLFNASLTSSVDLTKSLSVKVFVKPSVASPSLTIRKDWAYIELI